MLLFNVLILCWVFMFHRMNYEIEALIMYDPRIRYYSYNELARQARGGYGRYYDQDKIKIYSKASAKQPKKPSYSPASNKIKTQSPIHLSFQPLGALKLHSLTHGEIEFKPEALNNVFSSTASKTLSMVPDFNQYIPNLSSLYGTKEPTESSESQSQEESSRPRKHHRNSDQDDPSEENDRSSGDHEDHSEDKGDHKSDYNKEREDDEDNAAEEQHDSRNRTKSKHSRSSEQKNDSQDDENEPASENKNSNQSNSNEKSKDMPEIDPEIPIEDLPAQEGYVDKFMKYYSYAKPIAKAATLFVPGLGQYKALMFGMEMATLAYDTATIYQKGEGFMSMGWHLGKEAFKRLGRRSEPLEKLQDPDTKQSSIDIEEFLNQMKNTQYPALNEEKEQKIKSSVTKIVRKYFHDRKEYKNQTERTKFIDLMVSCVKFIALQLQQIIPATNENPT